MMAAGLPGSVQLAARRGGERTLLRLAYELEAASPFPRITDVASAAAWED
jgi:amidase